MCGDKDPKIEKSIMYVNIIMLNTSTMSSVSKKKKKKVYNLPIYLLKTKSAAGSTKKLGYLFLSQSTLTCTITNPVSFFLLCLSLST